MSRLSKHIIIPDGYVPLSEYAKARRLNAKSLYSRYHAGQLPGALKLPGGCLVIPRLYPITAITDRPNTPKKKPRGASPWRKTWKKKEDTKRWKKYGAF